MCIEENGRYGGLAGSLGFGCLLGVLEGLPWCSDGVQSSVGLNEEMKGTKVGEETDSSSERFSKEKPFITALTPQQRLLFLQERQI